MGLNLFPGDDNTDSPDMSWSYTGFGMFRNWLADIEGFTLDEMQGFRGGQRPWSDVSTTLAPLLNHSDCDGPDLSPAQCAAILPRLNEIAAATKDPGDAVWQRRIEDVRRLVVVLQVCIEKDVDLIFG
ncbi:hypothetical protein [Kitasatospora sp. DSM 101779]|uniref:hypothetical protein n=1 Tax=Kitasatospora sp. DSM 101779 TaxID=2853165 RepID=UPI0021DAAAB0|nr:hypothetical protein [Kitasatospora sp. DSM 101779]MCU7827021.1 hypothetical protein [Kitasatospora sp. DSM 101779]